MIYLVCNYSVVADDMRMMRLTSVTDLLLGVWGVVRVCEGYRVFEHGALKLLNNMCVRMCAYAPRFHMVCAGDDIGRRQVYKRDI